MFRSRPLSIAATFAVALALAVWLAPPSISVRSAEAQPAGTTQAATPPHIDVNDVLAHLQKLQSIADEAGGNRAGGTTGYAQSVDYVAKTLTGAGYKVELPECTSCTRSKGDHSVIIDLPGGDPNSTIMFGAHLDSVEEGPGIEDNASGSAALLQVALAVATAKPTMTKHVRFAWWASEEVDDSADSAAGHYVKTRGVRDLAAYINLDMIAAPNAGYFLTFMDNPYGKAMATYLEASGVPAEQMNGNCECADDQPFSDAKVPTTYLTTASNDEDNMSKEQAAKWHGKAGEEWDACYHSACDAYPKNINTTALDHTTNDVIQALWSLAV